MDDEECADGVMADEAVPVIKRLHERAYRDGITEHCKRHRGVEPPHVVNILVGEYLGHGREPGWLGTDLPQRLRETYKPKRRPASVGAVPGPASSLAFGFEEPYQLRLCATRAQLS